MEHAVIVRLTCLDLSKIFDLESHLESAIKLAAVGDYDGNDIGLDGQVTMYMYGPDADALFKIVEPIIKTPGLVRIVATLRYGPADDENAKETNIEFE